MITGNSNAQIKALSALIHKSKERRKQRLFVVEGSKMVAEAPHSWLKKVYFSTAFGAKSENQELLDQLKEDNISWEEVSDPVFKSVSDTQTPQGILAVVKMPDYELPQLLKGEKTLLLILDGIQDPGNLGTMLRTGEGAGVTGVIANKTTVDLYNPKTIRSTMGSVYRVPWLVTDDILGTIDRLRKEGIRLFAAHLAGTAYYDTFDFCGPSGFLIGNEGNGLDDAVAQRADGYLKIPMEGKVESLNAAVAASILLYEAARQRRK